MDKFIDNKIEEYNNLIQELNSKLKQEFTFDELLAKPFNELEELLKKYNISNITYKLDYIMNYKRYTSDPSYREIFKKAIQNYIVLLEPIMDEIINKIKLQNENIKTKINYYKKIIDSLNKIKEIIKNTKQYSKDNYDKIIEILNNDLPDEIVGILYMVSKYFIALENTDIIDLFEEDIKQEVPATNKEDEIIINTNKILSEYQNKDSKYYLKGFIYDGLNSEELDEVLNIIKENGYDLTSFEWLVGIYINEILNNNTSYYQELIRLNDMYKKSIDYKINLNNKINELLSLIINIDNPYVKNIKTFIEQINIDFIIDDEYYKKIDKQLSKYLEDINKLLKENVIKRKEIKKLDHFVLFAQNNEGNSYFKQDLFDPKYNMIDNRSFSNTEYYQEFSNLILDLFEYGMPSCAKFIDSKLSSNLDRVIMHIFYPTKKGIVDRDNPTDMWRIRPNFSSNARFVDVKVVIPRNTLMFNQVKEIINKYLPHIEINDNNFTFIVNIGAAVKKGDVELYKEAIKRYDKIGIEILKLFYVNGKYHKSEGVLKTKLNDLEYKLLDSYIASSINLLKELENINISFQFNSLLGGDNYGLSK